MTVAQKKQKLNPAQQSALEHILSLSEQKQARFLKLCGLYRASFDPEEKKEIELAVSEMLFPNADDLAAEPLDDVSADREAKKQLRAHREYVASQIALQRSKRGWTQGELSKKAGLPQSHVSRLERCVHAPTCLTLQKLADALGIDPGVLDPNFVTDEDVGDE